MEISGFIRSRKATLFCLLAVLIIVVWQLTFIKTDTRKFEEYRRTDASGFTHEFAFKFLYFYYYLGHFPLYSTIEDPAQSSQAAETIIQKNGETLRMEFKHWSRLGENARIWMYLPNAWMKGTAASPSVIPFNYLLFIGSLVFFFLAAYHFSGYSFAIPSTLLLGSSPFLVYETYAHENYFNLPICTGLLLFAINVGYLKNSRWAFFLPAAVISGLLLGITANIRSETQVMAAAVIFVYVTAVHISTLKRIMFCFIFLTAFLITKKSILIYFEHKYQDTVKIVEEAGGKPYKGERIKSHTFWHPVFCGLGDYGEDKGYEWNDRVAYRYALPIMNERYGLDLKWDGDLNLEEYYDQDNEYYKKLELYPEYEEILKEKVVNDIKNDPAWFAEIILKRIWNFLTHTSPLNITIVDKSVNIPLPYPGLLIFIAIPVFLWKKRYEWVRLILFSLPLATTSIIIYAKKNSTYNSIYHILCISLLICLSFEYLKARRKVHD